MAIALVQQKAASGNPLDAGTVVVTFDAPTTPGNLVTLQVGIGSSAGNPDEPTDDGTGENWNLVNAFTSGAHASHWVRTAGDACSAITVVNITGSTRAHGLVACEWSGVTTTEGADEGDDGSNGSQTCVLPAITPTLVPSLILVTACVRQNTISDIALSAGYTELGAPADAGDSSFAMGYVICTTDEARALTATTDIAVTTGTTFVAIQDLLLGTGAATFVKGSQFPFAAIL